MDRFRITEPGTPVGIPPEEIELTVRNVVGRMEYSKREFSSRRDTWKRILSAYEAEENFLASFGVKTPEARIHTPTMATQIDRLVQQLTYKMVQPYENFLEAAFRLTKQRAYKAENFLFDMFKRNEMATEVVKAVLNAALFGVGITKVIPNPSVPYPDCILQHIPMEDFHPDPNGLGIQKCTYIIEEMKIDYDTLVKNYSLGSYNIHSEFQRLMDDCTMRGTPDGNRLLVSSLLSPERISATSMQPSRGELRKVFPGLHYVSSADSMSINDEEFDRFTLLEYHDRHYRLIVINGKYLIKVQKVEMRYPYQAWYIRIDPKGRLIPKSHGELILPIHEEIDIKRNQRVENINKLNDPPILYTPTAITKISDFVIKSGAKIPVNTLDGIKAMDITNSTDTLFQEGQALKSEVGEITGVMGVIVGNAAKRERMTKTESAGLYSQASMPFDFSSAIMTITGMIPMFQCILTTCSVLGTVMGQGVNTPSGLGIPEDIQPSEFAADYDITISINPNKVTKDKQEALEILQILSQFQYIDQIVLLRWLLPRLVPDAPREILKEAPTGQVPPGTPPPLPSG